ncbi:Crotonase superfamily [Acididesulfobacillus acetoxydans]|uniref:short-chain-enoyl-CoA hydratase n=1 Tax=Acididesulfobacillus acetoxydans TaxID=1561005 RepID=A0A8S0WXR9_9FIRM|nr:enoyl-CoA hydratase-related protein [Acididesulfobacillus acetoxydans]CAA7601121.1 Crotonase superfamily [Acididesulfobacillus acetoxydans]CEJ08600.1 3-hydroxypropionyl-coenzyme A dehydratase [Acididesulfobacillus acetoxydans]
MSYEFIQVSQDDGVTTLTLNRPPMNPLHSGILRELSRVLGEVERTPGIKAVIITGAGEKAFAAGADIAEMVQLTPVEAYAFCHLTREAYEQIEKLGKPVIAAVNGLALGAGAELALACDFRLAAETAKLGQPEINLGIIPGAGGTQRLARLVGLAKAKELVFLGEIIEAEAAKKIGLVHQVVPAAELMAQAQKLARKLAAKPAVALRMAKEALNTGINLDLHSALILEIQNFVTAFASEDRREGLAAFLEKRKPSFKDT